MTDSINDCKCPQKSKKCSNGLWSTELLLCNQCRNKLYETIKILKNNNFTILK